MPYRRGRASGKLARLPINYIKHCVEDISTIAASTGRTQIIALGTLGDETTTTIGTGTRAENIRTGAKIFSIDCEVLMRAQAGNVKGFFEWAMVWVPPNQVFAIETADVNASGLARDLIGRYSGNVLRTGVVPFNINVSGKMHARIKLPRSKRVVRVGGTIVFVSHNHSNVVVDWLGKFIFKSYV